MDLGRINFSGLVTDDETLKQFATSAGKTPLLYKSSSDPGCPLRVALRSGLRAEKSLTNT
jgi:hypothetical protein